MAKKLALNIGIGATVNSSMGKSFDKAEKESADLAKSYAKINKQLGLTRDVKKYDSQLKKLNKRIEAGTGDTLAMGKVQAKLEKQLKKSERAAKNAGVDIRNLSRAEEKLAWSAKRAEREQEDLNRSMAKTARLEKLRGFGRSAMGYGQGTMVGRGVTAMGGSAKAAGAAGLAAKGVGAIGLTAGVVATGGFAASVRMNNDLDVIGKKADQLGVSTKALQEIQYAAGRTGVGESAMLDALKFQAKNISEAATKGTGEAVDALISLNLNAKELNKLSPDQQIMKIADAMEAVKNQNDKQQLALRIYGRSGAAMVNLLRGGSSELKTLRDEARVVSDELIRGAETFVDTWGDLKSSFKVLSYDILGTMQSNFIDSMNDVTNWFDLARNVFSDGALPDFQQKAPEMKDGKLSRQGMNDVLNNISLIDTIGSFFRDNEQGALNAASPEMKSATVAGNNTTTNSTTITIQTQPGQDSEQIANIVTEKLDERNRQQERQQRGMLYDMSPGVI